MAIGTAVWILVAASAMATAPRAANPCAVAPVAGTGNSFLSVDGVARGIHLHVPPRIPAGRHLPLVIVLGGQDSNGSQTEAHTGFSALADVAGFVVLYPSPSHGRWLFHSRGPAGDADVDFIGAAIDLAERSWCIDAARVFVAGGSNGAGEAARVACVLSNRIAAVALVAGSYARVPPCGPRHAVSVLELHSRDDRVAPYDGTGAAHTGSVPELLAHWRSFDRCDPSAARRRVNRITLLQRWSCAEGVAVEQIVLSTGGHAWPGSTTKALTLPGAGSAALDVWHFFASLA